MVAAINSVQYENSQVLFLKSSWCTEVAITVVILVMTEISAPDSLSFKVSVWTTAHLWKVLSRIQFLQGQYCQLTNSPLRME